MRYFPVVGTVSRELLVELSCIVPESKSSALKAIAVNVFCARSRAEDVYARQFGCTTVNEAVPFTVKFWQARLAYAESSASRTSMPVPFRLIAGKLADVPPSWRRPKSLAALLNRVITESAG